MNLTFLLFLLVGISNVFAGQIVYQNMYGEHNLVQGQGANKSVAEKDALKAIPKNYHKDADNSPAVSCLHSKLLDTGVCSEKKDVVLFTIPIVASSK